MSDLPPDVAEVISRYLDLIDRAAPGHLAALYLVGSLALGDYRPGSSDVDFVAVTEGEVDPVGLAAVHEALRPPMNVDGVYVTAADLAADPETVGERPQAFEGRVTVGPAFEINPAVWQTLAQGPIVVRGEPPQVTVDPVRLAAWTRGNLDTYWRQCRDGVAALPAELVDDTVVVWCGLGPARLVHTLETGRVTSKRGAGEWALRTRGDSAILREALTLRGGGRSAYEAPADRQRDLVIHMDALLGGVQ
ncbi:nucleotidyltransferase domain-containing protein [Nonomuraea sp. NPDC050328]|uniref:nucleotidyltransferase domain-containing protein n=1 Tax=Nonomuraea sp. NPDC050328 TaxID=3364361 RepID=UPI00378A19EC